MFERKQIASLSLVAAAALLSIASSSGADPYESEYVTDDSCESVFPASVVSGVLSTPVADLPYEGQRATVQLRHKRDVDREEDGCVAAATLFFSIEGDCRLRLVFEVVPDVSELVLVDASFHADSYCPGWSDELEAAYTYAGQGEGRLSVTDQMPEDTHEACVELELAPRGTITLSAQDREDLVVTLDGLATTGPAVSKGDTELSCPGA